MSGSFEKSVKGGTKIKLAPPKAKYVEHILVATHAGEAGVAEIFRALQNRLRDSTWTIVFKALIIVHLMIREGEPNVTLKYVADSPPKLAISNFSDGTSKEYNTVSARGPTEVQVQGTNIRHYYTYMLARAKAYRDTRIDWVREGVGRLKRQTVDKGLLRETEAVQSQISKLLECDLLSTEAENEITVCAFRLLTMDLLVLYGVMNEGTINVLEHYFEMSRYDAERALSIYKTFTKQTNLVVEFLSTARQYENATRLEIPKLKHAPTSLTGSLQEYLNDPDFEVNRRQYLAQQAARKGGKKPNNGVSGSSNQSSKLAAKNTSSSKDFPKPKTLQAAPPPKVETKGPAPDLIDFFESIETNQQPMASAPQQQQQVPNFGVGPHYQQQQQLQQQLQQTGVLPQQGIFGAQNGVQSPVQNSSVFGSSNPFAPSQAQQPVNQDFRGAAFGGFGHQQFQQPQQNAVSNGPQNSQSQFSPQQDIFSSIHQNTGSQFQQPQQSFNTGSEPFSPGQQSFSPPQRSMTTGASNPFRQSAMPTGASVPSYTSSTQASLPTSPQSTNPFARNLNGQLTGQTQSSPFSTQSTGTSLFTTSPYQQGTGTPFTSSPPQQQSQNTPFTSPPPQPLQQQQQQPIAQPLTSAKTGTNPFARSDTFPTNVSTPIPAQPLTAQPTGSTNPFRQSTFANQHTGQGWPAGQGTMGGLEQLPTMPVFPRPQQQQGTWPG